MNRLQNGALVPQSCFTDGGRRYLDTCRAICNDGYHLYQKSAEVAHCDQNGNWDLGGKFEAQCEREKI